MARKNTSQAYGSIAKSFHWLMALLILAMLAAGLVMTGMDNTPDKFRLYGLHKSFGVLVLALACLRLAWRLRNIVPPLPASLAKWQRYAARASHGLLYGLMFAMPLSGWAMSSAAGFPVSFFGWFTLPDWVAPDRELQAFLRDLHGWLAYALIGLIGVHASAALLHHFYYKDQVLRRMLPFRGADHA